MMDGPERFQLPTVDGSKVEVFVNWTEGVDKCDFVKFRIDGKRDIVIPKSVLLRLAMFIGDEDEQDALIPTTSVPIRQFRKQLSLTTLRPIEAGEPLKFTVTFDVPVTADTIPLLEKTFKVFT